MKVLSTRATRSHQPEQESITDRQERIEGWRQDRVAAGRALLLGAGALGNEAAKNLALMGLGYLFIADMDSISHSNLSRAVFFRPQDARQKKLKAEVVARRAQALNVTKPSFVQPFSGDIVWQLGAGVYRRVDVVLGCLDNVEARLKANLNCLLTHTPFLDGGILGLAGTLTAVHPPETACWECTTSARERANAKNRYDSCSLVMLRSIEEGRLPTVQVASSIIAGFQTQEAMKVIQGQPWSAGRMIQYDASGKQIYLDSLAISRRPTCWCNDVSPLDEVLELPLMAAQHTMHDLLALLAERGYANPCVALPGPFVIQRSCRVCKRRGSVMSPLFHLNTDALVCSFCGNEGNEAIELLSVSHTGAEEFEKIATGPVERASFFQRTLAELGFPALAIVRFALQKEPQFQFAAELSADAPLVMGGAQFASVRERN